MNDMKLKLDSPPLYPREVDTAVFGKSILGGSHEPLYSGVLSFMRRRLSRDLAGVDVAVWGIPFDAAVSNRPGARFGPQGVRRASAILEGDPQYPFKADPFETLAVIDYGDCSLDYGRHFDAPAQIEGQAREVVEAGVTLLSIGGDHYVTWPLLKAHAKKHGPMALVQFDAHQDTWFDEDARIDHGSFVARAVREGIIIPERSIQIGIRTHAPETCGLEILYGEDVAELGVNGVRRTHQSARGRRARPTSPSTSIAWIPALRARDRNAGFRRAFFARGSHDRPPARLPRHCRSRRGRGRAGL